MFYTTVSSDRSIFIGQAALHECELYVPLRFTGVLVTMHQNASEFPCGRSHIIYRTHCVVLSCVVRRGSCLIAGRRAQQQQLSEGCGYLNRSQLQTEGSNLESKQTEEVCSAFQSCTTGRLIENDWERQRFCCSPQLNSCFSPWRRSVRSSCGTICVSRRKRAIK